jgi:hypothetical protein
MTDWLRARPWWVWVVLGVAALAAAYGAGRYTAPSKVEYRTVTEFSSYFSRQTTRGPVRKTGKIETVVLPNGERRTTHEYVLDKGPVVTLEAGGTVNKTDTTSTTTYDAPRLTLGLKGGVAIDNWNLTWGAFAHYRVTGPLVFGVDYTRKDNVVQGTVGITF